MKRFFALALFAGLAACGGTQPAQETPEQQARAVRVGTVQQRPLDLGISASGNLVPREEALVGSELAGYRVAAVLVEEGDVVRQGQPLARLDPTLLEADIARARGAVLQAQAQAARASAEARRVAGLDNQGVLAQEQIEQRRFDASGAAASLVQSRAQLADLLTRRARMVIRAPVSGTIIERNVAPGAISSTSTSGGATTNTTATSGNGPLFRIARDSLIELAAELSEADLGRVTLGGPVRVTLPSGQTVDGVVRLISPRISGENQLGIARIRLPVRPDLRAGGTASATFQGVVQQVAAVPETAVQFTGNGASVMVVGQDNRARRVAVRPGRRSGGWVELLQGPPLGSRILLSGAAFVLEGDLVRPVDDAQAAREEQQRQQQQQNQAAPAR